jgi:hypothetical protein
MSDPFLDYGKMLADERVTTVVATLADVLPNDLPPDISLVADGSDLILSGTNLIARYVSDVRLNGIAMTAKAVLA